MPAPSTSILDDFNRANEAPLSGGGNWSRTGSVVTQLNLSSNQVAGTASTTSQESYVGGGSLTDCEAYCTIATLPGSGNSVMVIARHNTGSNTGNDCYMGAYSQGTGVQLYKVVGGTITQLGSTTVVTLSAGDKIAVQCVGTTISVWYFTGGVWTQGASVTDSAHSAGYLGIRVRGTTGRIDDFGGGTISSALDYTDSATVSGSTTPSSSDISAFVESAVISSKTTPSSSEQYNVVDAATIASVTIVSGSEISTSGSAYLDSATVGSKTSIGSLDVSAFIDSNVVTGITTPDVLVEIPTTINVTVGISGSTSVGSIVTATISFDVSGGSIGGGGGGTPITDPDAPGYDPVYSPAGDWGSSDDDNGLIP